MIIISNSPFNIAEIRNEYGNNSLQTAMLTALDRETEKINYESIGELKFELDLRAALVEASIKLSQSKLGFAVFRRSKCNNKYWRRTRNGGFQLLPDVKPSAAILDIYNNGHLYATECATAMVIVLYKALLTVFNQNEFNRIFSNIYLMNWHSLDSKIDDIGQLRPTEYYLPGDRRYFYNPDVAPEKSELQGENTIQLTQDRHYAHDFGIVSAGQIITTLNTARKRNATRSAFLRDGVGRPNFNYLYRLKTQL